MLTLGTSGSPGTKPLSGYHHRALYRVLTPQTLSPSPKKGGDFGQKSCPLCTVVFSLANQLSGTREIFYKYALGGEMNG